MRREPGRRSLTAQRNRTHPCRQALAQAAAGRPRRRHALRRSWPSRSSPRSGRSPARPLLPTCWRRPVTCSRSPTARSAPGPAWDAAVRTALPAGAGDGWCPTTSRRVVSSGRCTPTSRRHLHKDLPDWRIVAAAPRDASCSRYYRAAERRFGVDWEYLAAINLVETGFGRIRGTSVAGAQGPMQFIPTTWDIYGPRRHQLAPRLDPRRRALPEGATASPDRRAAGALRATTTHSAYVRGVSLVAKLMQRRPRAFLRLLPLEGLLPDPRRERAAARGLRLQAPHPGSYLSGRASRVPTHRPMSSVPMSGRT